MRTTIKQIISFVTIGVAFFFFLISFSMQGTFSHKPHIPNPATGEIKEWALRGVGTVYLTEKEYNDITWPLYAAGGVFVAGIIIHILGNSSVPFIRKWLLGIVGGVLVGGGLMLHYNDPHTSLLWSLSLIFSIVVGAFLIKKATTGRPLYDPQPSWPFITDRCPKEKQIAIVGIGLLIVDAVIMLLGTDRCWGYFRAHAMILSIVYLLIALVGGAFILWYLRCLEKDALRRRPE